MYIIELLGQTVNTTLVFATALILAALGGIFSERSGVINIGLEGLMTSGAVAAAVASQYAEQADLGNLSPWIGLVAAVLFSMIFALIHAVATITFKGNQVVSGVVINFLAVGTSIYLVKILYNGAGDTPSLNHVFHKWAIPLLSRIPLLGEGIFTAYPTTFI